MRFGVREIANVVLRAKATQTLGSRKFYKNEPVLYFDTLKTSSLEGAATTVYATGGRGNTRLVAWEGERTLTFTMEDALISPESFSILSGASLISATEEKPIYVHMTSQVQVKTPNIIELPETPCWSRRGHPHYKDGADIFVMTMTNGQIDSEPCVPLSVEDNVITCFGHAGTIDEGDVVLVDYYVEKKSNAQQIEITADKFGGNYYLEADTLFRDEATGVDMPAEFIIPNCKVQSNFTFSMASTGDPSTFSFTLDAFPDYTKFDRTHKVLAAIQVITEGVDDADEQREPCHLVEVTALDPDVRVIYDNLGFNPLIKVTAEGNNIDGRAKDEKGDPKFYEKALFGDLTATKDLTQITLQLNVEAGKNYTVVQQNPALANFETDPNITGTMKTKDYTGEQLEDGYGIVLGDQAGTVKVVVTDKATNEVIQTIQITNNITFVKKSKLVIDDADNKIATLKINGEIVEDVSQYTGDGALINGGSNIVITSVTANSVSATGIMGKVKQDTANNTYTMTINNNSKDVKITVI